MDGMAGYWAVSMTPSSPVAVFHWGILAAVPVCSPEKAFGGTFLIDVAEGGGR